MSKPLTKDFESMKIAKLITLNNGSNLTLKETKNETQHTKIVQEQVIM